MSDYDHLDEGVARAERDAALKRLEEAMFDRNVLARECR